MAVILTIGLMAVGSSVLVGGFPPRWQKAIYFGLICCGLLDLLVADTICVSVWTMGHK